MTNMKPQKPWRQAVPVEPDPWWHEIGVILLHLAILLTLILGLPFLLWLAWGATL